jgi:hypothetical protein
MNATIILFLSAIAAAAVYRHDVEGSFDGSQATHILDTITLKDNLSPIAPNRTEKSVNNCEATPQVSNLVCDRVLLASEIPSLTYLPLE